MSKKNKNSELIIGMVGTLPPPIGGVTVLYQILVEYLGNRKHTSLLFVHLRTGQIGLLLKVLRAFEVIIGVARVLPRVDVLTIHLPTLVLPIIGPPCVILAKLFNKPILIRKFGGTDYTQFGWLKRKLSSYVVRNSDIYLAEAKKLVEIAQADGAKNAQWFPNNRPLLTNMDCTGLDVHSCRRFVYVGQIRLNKGVKEITKAVNYLDNDSTVDVYGPFYDGLSEDDFRGSEIVAYKGILEPDEVISKLCEYDALLLPTFHDGEGYPGVILEAFIAGIPVICTRWRYLPEIVDETCGIFVDVGSADSLAAAMMKMSSDDELYEELRRGAIKRANYFDSERWSERFYLMCQSLNDGVDSKHLADHDLNLE